jgi:hypothetical protein
VSLQNGETYAVKNNSLSTNPSRHCHGILSDELMADGQSDKSEARWKQHFPRQNQVSSMPWSMVLKAAEILRSTKTGSALLAAAQSGT